MSAYQILIVDDEDVERQTWQRILQLDGYAVEGAASGSAALAWLSQRTFDLMILDLKMPDMNGIEMLREVSQTYPNLRTIILTAYGDMDTAVQALRLKASDYLTKPIHPQQLLDTIWRILTEPDSETAELPGETTGNQRETGKTEEPTIYKTTAGVRIDLLLRKIVWENEEISLTPIEAKTMKCLLQNYQKLIAPELLVKKVYGYDTTAYDASRTLRPVISRLYKKLAQIPTGQTWVQNVRGAGYILNFAPETLIN